MTNRVQTLRSSTSGSIPAAGTRQPGELWTNFPDLQLGVIDASKNAQRLVAVRYFSTTANYAVGDFVVQAGVLYAAKVAITAGAFNAGQWVEIGSATDAGGPYLPLAGGTLTGDLVLNRDPQVALGAATKQYVDGKVTAAPFLPLAGGTLTGLVTLSGPPTAALHAATKAYVDSGAFVPITGGTMTGDLILNRDAQVALGAATLEQVQARGSGANRIINGDMRIDQRNNGASGTAIGYTVDRWQYSATQATKGVWQRTTPGAAAAAQGIGNALNFTSSSAYASLATDAFCFLQPIEADMVTDFAWGTPNAQSVTFSFWTNSTVTGTFSGVLAANPFPSTRGYPFTFSIPAANVWTKIAVTIPGDTGGTWVMSGNGAGCSVAFDLGSGANFRGPAGAWGNGNWRGANGAISVVGANGATFNVTGVKLEIGSVATPFNRQSLAKSMADCQRYYQVGTLLMTGYSSAAGQGFSTSTMAPVVMRLPGPWALTVASSGNSNWTMSGLNYNSVGCFISSGVAIAAGAIGININFTANAEL